MDWWNPITTSAIQAISCPMWFLCFSNHEKVAPRQEILKWSTVCSTFLKSGWSVIRSALLAKGGTLKKRPSPHLHKVPTRSNKVGPQTLRIAPVLSVQHSAMLALQLCWTSPIIWCILNIHEFSGFIYTHIVRQFVVIILMDICLYLVFMLMANTQN